MAQPRLLQRIEASRILGSARAEAFPLTEREVKLEGSQKYLESRSNLLKFS